jgi:hypothetical protein
MEADLGIGEAETLSEVPPEVPAADGEAAGGSSDGEQSG